ncbi:biofilm regulation protein kinase SiaB [Methylomagnum sp.]
MKPNSLYALRERFNGEHILICFNGPISRSLIEEIGNALRSYLQSTEAHASAAMDVFSVYIEMSQNIRHYAGSRGYDDMESSATVVIASDDSGHYTVSAGNMVEMTDGLNLVARVEALAGLDKPQLKAAYKEQLRKPRESESSTGAGLGLIEMARKSSAPLEATLDDLGEGRAFFSLRAVI